MDGASLRMLTENTYSIFCDRINLETCLIFAAARPLCLKTQKDLLFMASLAAKFC